MEVVWTGTKERADAERARIYAAPPPEERVVVTAAAVRQAVRMRGEATMSDIAAALGTVPSRVSGVVYRLKGRGELVKTKRFRVEHEYRAYFYRLAVTA